MKIHVTQTQRSNAFTMVEMVLTVAVVAILALIGTVTITTVKPAAELSKIQSDTQVLNTAIKMYKHSGGDLSSATTAGDVIAKLKTIRQKSTSQSFVGFTGSMIDSRLTLVPIPATQKGARAVYDNAAKRFYVTSNAVAGYRFDLLDQENGVQQIEESRAESALEYAVTSNWVWDYQDAPAPARLDPTLVTKVTTITPTPNAPETVETPTTPPSPVLAKLLPPTFSIPFGHYNLSDFPMALILNNPNGSSTGKIIYGIISSENWQWQEYTGPINVGPSDKVLAFVESAKPQEFHHSDPVDEYYDWIATLGAPQIEVSSNEIEARAGSVTVTITHENNPDYFQYGEKQLPISSGSFQVEYKLIPLVAGEGTETGWATYSSPFDVGGPQFPKGFEVVSRVKSNTPNFIDSGEANQSVSGYYKLDTPQINSNKEFLTHVSETAVISISNPNPPGSSQLVYQILDHLGNSTTGWLDYSASFSVSGNNFPRGFTIVSKALPLNNYYRNSNEVNKILQVQFYGIELTGKTIFILDSSGSMLTNARISRLKTATVAVLSSFNTHDQFAIIDYDSTPKILSTWGSSDSSRKTAAINSVKSMIASGGTMYNSALLAAISLNAVGAKQVIFLSDGLPNDAPNPILQSVQNLLSIGIERFDTISLGVDSQILKDMASAGNGKNTIIND